jgi:hypothetical protein
LRARYPWRRFWTRRDGRNVTRRTPREALAENDRVCEGAFWERSDDRGEKAVAVAVAVVVGEERRLPSVREAWKRVGVERREEKDRDESIVEGVLGCCGILANLLQGGVEVLAVWYRDWKGWCFAYLFIGVRMADVVARKAEGTALARRQNIFRALALSEGD